ncbi:phosphotransferase [Hyalangium rubrum]|uniref:Phosphotransferase n=1 Tax=Hyalangium rubrum TaxID=3103134 RepID=A0ABU5H1X3_9BACT|nr:phosphotransferase [Hyalangium sp. s54d21]MDY7227451.1 phosphotransferase [Hyalangium sp. s54d21]
MTTSAGPRYAPVDEVVGRWRLLERAGGGTFGTVFRAQLTSEPGTVAAVKIARHPGDPRFEREAKLLDEARSPHLPRLLDKGEWTSPAGQRYPYLVMQWVEGLSLYAWRNARGLTQASAAQVLCHVARALADTSSAEPPRLLPPGALVTVAPELERLILPLLSKNSQERGSAAELAQALEQAAASAGHAPIAASPSVMETQKTARPGPRPRLTVPSWLTWAGSSALGACVVIAVWTGVHGPKAPEATHPSVRAEEEKPEASVSDERRTSLADAGVEEALAAVHELPSARFGTPHFGREMPREPFKGQRKPPCGRLEVAINGACWVEVGRQKPPCGNDGFDWNGLCYIPSFNSPRQPTSGEP